MKAHLDGVTVADDDAIAVTRWLGAFEVAIPLRPYHELAESHGSEAERELTKALVGDLRQPVYDHRMIFARDGYTKLSTALTKEKLLCQCSESCGLPLLRAIWRVKPLILALPRGWVQEAAA